MNGGELIVLITIEFMSMLFDCTLKFKYQEFETELIQKLDAIHLLNFRL